jgi:membrane-associated protease RseP (regulator of RpoE activity)
MMDDARDFIASLLPARDTTAKTGTVPRVPALQGTVPAFAGGSVPSPLAYETDTTLAARDTLLYLLGSRRETSSESLLTAVMKDHSAPSKLRQTAYSALIKLATPTAWQAVKATPRVVCADKLVPGGNGEKAGLKPDDVIVSYNGKAVKKTSDLRDAIAAVKPGAKDVPMVIERQGKRLTLRLPPGRVGVYLSERVK